MVSVAISEVEHDSAAGPPTPSGRAGAISRTVFGKSWIWAAALALQDTKLRYRGSVPGPFWTISTW